jgi:hypothetical protein
MSTSTIAPARRAHSVPICPAVRHHRGQVARWALANGQLIERDALAAIVAVRADLSTGTIDLRWTADEVGRVMWSSVPMWCSTHQVRHPADLATTMAAYLRHLSAHGQLARGSDPIAVLRKAVADHRPGPQRSRARHPAAGRTAPVLPIC